MAKVEKEDRAKAACERWKRTERLRKEANRKKNAGELPDAPERIVRHANRLRTQVIGSISSMTSQERRSLPPEVKELADREPILAVSPALERVIGKSKDFLSAEFFELGIYAMRSVARITTEREGNRYYATGFMVAPDLMLTNHHVLEQQDWAEASVVEFDYQLDRWGKRKPVQEFRFDPARFFLNDRRLDFALVAVGAAPTRGNGRLSDFGFCPLIGTDGKILIKDPVNIIQHPDGRLKEVVIRENSLEALPEEPGLEIYAQYLADTEGGSSGSPVFNDRWEVIALHHQGVARTDDEGRWLAKDGRLWTKDMGDAEVDWIGNEGIRVSAIVKHLAGRQLSGEKAQLMRSLLETSRTSEPGPVISERGSRSGDAEAPAAAQAVPAQTIEVPITVRIEIGGGGPRVSVSRAGGNARENVMPAGSYHQRPGFDGNFLGLPVPMPSLADLSRGGLAALDDGSTELKYHHYSVLFNVDRRLAYVSAVNFKSNARFFEERGKDKWFFDPRVDRTLQADDRFYRDNDLDRGHLTRRYDAGWGDTEEEATQANDDTFHWTNCSPQHEMFNQSKLSQPLDLRLWGELENHVTAQARKDTPLLSIFNGPVFGDDDRFHRGLAIPSSYWKIIAFRSGATDDARLRAVGFIISQKDQIANLPAEAAKEFAVGKFDLWQVKISRIEELTGLDFKGLRNADPMAATRPQEMGSAERRLASLGDIRL